MTTKSEISRNSYQDTTISLYTEGGHCPDRVKLLCAIHRKAQIAMELSTMKNTMFINFSMPKKIFLEKTYFSMTFQAILVTTSPQNRGTLAF